MSFTSPLRPYGREASTAHMDHMTSNHGISRDAYHHRAASTAHMDHLTSNRGVASSRGAYHHRSVSPPRPDPAYLHSGNLDRNLSHNHGASRQDTSRLPRSEHARDYSASQDHYGDKLDSDSRNRSTSSYARDVYNRTPSPSRLSTYPFGRNLPQHHDVLIERDLDFGPDIPPAISLKCVHAACMYVSI